MKRIIALVLAVMMLLSACSSGTAPANVEGGESAEKAMDELKTIYGSELATLNYLKLNTTDSIA